MLARLFVGLNITLLVVACGQGAVQVGVGDGPPLIVATTTHLADFARVVAGDRAEVYQVLRPGVSPHDYEPTPVDLDAVATADVVVHNGFGLEAFWGDLVAAAVPEGTVVDASGGVPLLKDVSEEAGHEEVGDGEEAEVVGDEHAVGRVDPHIWHDPTRARTMVANLARALVEADANGAEGYQARTGAYLDELDRLDADIARHISALPNDKLVTNHDAFGYYVDRYDLDYVGAIIPSFDSTAELSVDDVADIVGRIRAEEVKAVFSESDLPPRTADAIGTEAGVAVVAGEHSLFGDSLGPPGSGAETYLEMMRHNTEVIVANLS